MDKKGENTMAGVGVFMGIFVLVIVGIALFQASAQQVGSATDLVDLVNVSLNGPSVDNTPQYFLNYKLIGTPVIFNATGNSEIPADNFTLTNNVIDPTTTALSVNITPTTTAVELGYDVGTWTISGEAQPVGYIADSGARSVAALIAIFFALAIAIVALEPTLRSGVLNMVGK